MSFLSPLGLLAALGVAVPILLHLLRRRRERTVDFPAVRFLLLARRRTSRRLRLRRLLLLALRCAAVLLLALVLARPVRLAPGSALQDPAAGWTAVLLDTSLSMTARTGSGTRLERARELAAALATRGGEDARFALVDLAPGPSGTTARWTGGGPFREALGALEARAAVADPGRAFSEAFRLAGEAGPGPRRIVVVTDLARGGWEGFLAASLPRIDVEVPVRVYRIGGDGAANHAGVLGLGAAGESRLAGELRELEVRVANFGPAARLPIEVWLDGRLVASRVEEVTPGSVAQASIPLRPPAPGARRLEVRLPGDGYAADDVRRLGLAVRHPVSVLLVDGEPAGSLVLSETFFLREVLRPARLAATLPVRVDVGGPDALAALEPGAHDVVVLANLRAPGGAEAARLARFVSSGGGLAVFWGRNCDPAEYRRALGALLPGVVRGVEQAPPGGGWSLGEVDYQWPPTAVLRPPGGGTLATARFGFRAAPIDPAPTAAVPVRFEDGSPWLVAGPVGSGRVLLAGSTADLEGSDLPTRPAFVPLVQRLVLWLAGALERSRDAETVAGSPLVIEAGPGLAGSEASIAGPDGRGHNARFFPEGPGSRAVLPQAGEPGFYRWSAPGGEGGVLAVNPPPEESDLSPLGDGEIRERFAPLRAEVVEVAPGGEDEDPIRIGSRSLTRPLLVALLLVLLLEPVAAGTGRRVATPGSRLRGPGADPRNGPG